MCSGYCHYSSSRCVNTNRRIQRFYLPYVECKMSQIDGKIYRISKKSFPDYKHLLQENYVEYKHIQTINTLHKILQTNLSNGKNNIFVFQVVFL
jgi:hypothetical protein